MISTQFWAKMWVEKNSTQISGRLECGLRTISFLCGSRGGGRSETAFQKNFPPLISRKRKLNSTHTLSCTAEALKSLRSFLFFQEVSFGWQSQHRILMRKCKPFFFNRNSKFWWENLRPFFLSRNFDFKTS